jgi:Flp pilus assembly protein TadB
MDINVAATSAAGLAPIRQPIAKEGDKVGIGGSIFLIALGAIFAFAVNVSLGWLDLQVVGWVMMIAGVFGLILTMWFWQSRRRTVVTRSTATPAPPATPGESRVVEEQYRSDVRPPDRPY